MHELKNCRIKRKQKYKKTEANDLNPSTIIRWPCFFIIITQIAVIDIHLVAAMERGEADVRTRTRIEMGGEVGYLTLTPTATSEGSHGRSRDGALAGERGGRRRESSACLP